jgi:hypothetical protein
MKLGKLMFVLCSLNALTATAWAWDLGTFSFGLNAPSINGKTDARNVEIGDILHDTSDSTFYGCVAASSGTCSSWVPLGGSAAANVVVSSSSGEAIERARISWSGGTPQVDFETGNWLSSPTDVGTGEVSFTMTGFSAQPSCFCTHRISPAPTASTVLRSCVAKATSATALTVYASYLNGSLQFALEDSTDGLDIQCAGSR